MTDNNPLTYVLTSAKLDAAGHRWLAALSSFDFNIQYRAGKKNQDADGLSRHPHPHDEYQPDFTSQDEDNCIQCFLAQFLQDDRGADFPSDTVKAVCQRHQHISSASTEPDFQMPVPVECLAIQASAIPVGFCQADVLGSCTLPQMSLQDWAREQRQDPVISRVIEFVKAGKRLSYRLRRQEDREAIPKAHKPR